MIPFMQAACMILERQTKRKVWCYTQWLSIAHAVKNCQAMRKERPDDGLIRRPAQRYDCGIGYRSATVISLAGQDRGLYG